jgi:hypothetical protein
VPDGRRAGHRGHRWNPARARKSRTPENLAHGKGDDGWKDGWRDGGTADTRPRIAAAPGAFHGRDAIVMDAWFPNSTEFLEHKLDPQADGKTWNRLGLKYIAFWCKAEGTEGEMCLNLNARQTPTRG